MSPPIIFGVIPCSKLRILGSISCPRCRNGAGKDGVVGRFDVVSYPGKSCHCLGHHESLVDDLCRDAPLATDKDPVGEQRYLLALKSMRSKHQLVKLIMLFDMSKETAHP